jgi:hypothetical protein
MTNYYLIITNLLAGVEAADKAQSDAQHLHDQRVAPLREGRLAHQRSGGLGCDVQVVGVHGVQSYLKVKLTEPTEQGVCAPLQGGRSHPQDLEAGTIHSFSLSVSFSY